MNDNRLEVGIKAHDREPGLLMMAAPRSALIVMTDDWRGCVSTLESAGFTVDVLGDEFEDFTGPEAA